MQDMQSMQNTMIVLAMTKAGASPNKIAAELRLSEAAVIAMLKSPLVVWVLSLAKQEK